MTEFVLFCVPTLIHLVVQSRGKDRTLAAARGRAGLKWGKPVDYLWALALLLPLVLTGWLAVALIPGDVLEAPGVTDMRVTSVAVAAGIVLRAAGEEVLFRGLLGGIFMRRLGFGWGNVLQAVVFLVPHLVLLVVDARMWPILPVQFVAGLLLGWLRHSTGTLVPGAAVHAVANCVAGLLHL
ncbi:CPBP family intramembrane glutamic endopeptidase [Parenemella sanctibonifatiensis]|uniref:CPBP family intramembrane metalloprotease n=1 Tax=Parenemella sanctibonifatiensis TaxID=2016505 RepID=A0A255EJ58_9ACTN|nr:CPBP family intramembrane glutamic endopeptidase [Parenemella sanctibonifatiensis]OYN91557.1 CPBP family intramembrane metalloprotease [Parenemella sanctibonifatiensis]